jgi:hypothetical protein
LHYFDFDTSHVIDTGSGRPANATQLLLLTLLSLNIYFTNRRTSTLYTRFEPIALLGFRENFPLSLLSLISYLVIVLHTECLITYFPYFK